MFRAAKKYVYCLVPYADVETRQDQAKTRYALEKFGHITPGYDVDTLSRLFPNAVHMAGTYFEDAGTPFRQKLKTMSMPDIDREIDALCEEARNDLRDVLPRSISHAAGIKVLSRVE